MATPLTASSLADLPDIAHGFFTRRGGVSQGIYASLNCGLGSGDQPAAVRENRARVAAHLNALALVTAHQAHSSIAVVAEEAWGPNARPSGDAIVTKRRGLAVGVLAADCAPVLIADPRAGVVAAAHAGWRGGIAGIVEAAIAAMEELGASKPHMLGAVGPCIGQAAYEVGEDLQREFLMRDAESARFFSTPRAGARPHFDLSGYVALRLQRAGVAAEAIDLCTFADPDRFFSYRRAQTAKEPDYGRQISAIVLT